jgi:AcrR family transcriptional regulator
VKQPGGGVEGPASTRLPAGRHGLPAEFVAQNQRARLMIASVELVAERGYTRVSVEAVVSRAKVSKRTFYQQFSGLWDCLSAAYAVTSGQFCEAITQACPGAGAWPERLSGAVEAALAWAVENPRYALLLSGEPPASVEQLRLARGELTERLASLMRSGRSQRPDATLPPGLEERLIGAALSLVAARLMAGNADTLPELGPELTELLVRPYRPPHGGSGRCHRSARSERRRD